MLSPRRLLGPSLFFSLCVVSAIALLDVACGGGDSGAGDRDTPDGGNVDPDASDTSTIVDNGEPSTVYPAFPFQTTTAMSAGGPVLATPTIVPITFSNDADGDTLIAHVQAFVASAAWGSMVGEYGVGAGSVTAVQLADVAPAKIDDTDLQAMLVSHLAGDHAGWPAPDPSHVFVFYLPLSTTVTDKGATGCADFEGYHGEIAFGGGDAGAPIQIPYAVVARCNGSGIGSALDTAAWSSTHEILEAVTDPYPKTHGAFRGVDDDSAAFTLFTGGGELADLCFMTAPAQEATSKHLLSRIYSNQAAAARHNPCVPSGLGEDGPYFQSVPVLPEKVSFSYKGATAHVPGITIPVGSSGDLEIDLASAGKTKAWTVDLYDYHELLGTKPTLKFTLDRNSGVNGEKLHAKVDVIGKDPSLGAELFLITSSLGSYVTYTVGVVAH